ncbi:hypothetical protein FBY06_101210 [Pseudomonas sp. SJZ085]|uniref:Ig-like domain-containing protein n=1 Tax=unclassified Pseudomonas TaxID=196821 RepID=UPI00119C7A4B|nr:MULTISPECIES: Ig-like domain-containing protein [unclassified Pseudomonas]TWC25672.1 hypothetical protein FBX99_101210 [Pseudomonas sp. SJZ074]TWC42483.1 hypothetical protein FBY06_101210 [Pseudomonas sp. SJZ085]
MNREPVNTRTNILPNGHFDMGYSEWGPVGGEDYDVKQGDWEGHPIYYMSIYKGTGITQKVPAPAARSAKARYRLSFLYDNRSVASGLFVLRRLGTEDSLEIALPSSAHVADPEGRALELTPVSVLIGFDVEQDDLFEFVITSPSQATAFNDVIVARIDFHLELDPLVLAQIVNDGQSFTPTAEPVLYLCQGATGSQRHQVSFQPAADSPWHGTEALLWSQDNPLEAVIVTPEWGETQSLVEAWEVDCPELLTDDTQVFNLSIYSKYHADTYPISVSLGHHRLMVETVLEPAYEPVVEYEQSVKLKVRVKSYYLDLPMRDCPVSWVLDGVALDVVNTDDGGFAAFDFTPATAGSLPVQARVDSPFYAQGHALSTINVKAHATDPLKTVRVKFPDMDAAPWGEKTGYPDRGASYRLEVTFGADSPLLNRSVWLEWDGKSPGELGVTAFPDFLHPVTVTSGALVWRLDCEDRLDGEFNLRLKSAALLEPTVLNLMSLARHNLKIGPVREANRVPVVDEQDYVWCMLQVTSLGNDPVAGVPVEWDTSTGLQRTWTGVNGWASVVDRPAVHGDYTLTARVNPREDGQVLGHDFQIQTLPTSAWKTARFTLGDVVVDRVGAGAVCSMGQAVVFKLTVEVGSPLIGKEVSLRWQDPDSAASIVIADMGTPVPITATGVQWNVEPRQADTSGVFDLHVISTGMEPLDLAFRLLPQDLSAEVELVFDQVPKAWSVDTKVYPCLGAIHELTVQPVDNLGGLHGLLLETRVAPDLPSGWVISPPLTEKPPMTAGGVRYRCDFTATTATAERSWAVHVLGVDAFTQPPAFGLKLAHNKVVIDTPYEVATDPVLSKGESARLAVRYVSAFTGRPANDVSVAWEDGDGSLSGADGIAQRDYRPAMAGNQEIQARVSNLYDATEVAHTFAVYAHEEDPWLDLNVHIHSGEPRPWGEHTFFPRRKERLDLTLSVPPGSPLLNQELKMGFSGAHELDTALVFGPVGLGESLPWRDDGVPISLVAGDQTDAAFYLQLAASRLLSRSPLNAFSLGSHVPVDVMAATNEGRTVVDWGETLSFEITLISALTGQPARNAQVTWSGTDEAMEPVVTTTNFYGVARFAFIATVAGPGTVTARAVAGVEVVAFDYLVHEACVIQSLTGDDLEGVPGDEISAEATVVSAATGEPVKGVKVHWFFKGVVLEPVPTDEQGKARVVFELPSRIGRYVLSASVRGEFGWDSDRLPAGVLGTVDSWVQEFTLRLDERPIDMDDLVNRRMYFTHAKSHILELSVKKDSSLINSTNVSLHMREGEALQLEFDPPLFQSQPVSGVPLRWVIVTKESRFGSFELQFVSPALPSRSLPSEVNV